MRRVHGPNNGVKTLGLGCLVLPAMWLVVVAGQAAESDVTKKNVVIVLDASGSMKSRMSGTSVVKMDAAKQALLKVLKTVPDDTQIGVLVFSAGNLKKDEEWIYPLGPRDDARLQAAINRPQPYGKTPLGAYIKKGADRLLEERTKQMGYGTYRLLVVTDGQASDSDYMRRNVPEVIARGITMDVIGVDMRSNHMLATQAHSYRAANNPQELERAIAEVFVEVGADGLDVVGESAFAELAPIPNEVALAMLKAISTTANHPIGTRPSPRVNARPPKPREAPKPPSRVQQPPRPAPRQSPSGSSGGGRNLTGFIIVIAFAIFLGILFIRKTMGG